MMTIKSGRLLCGFMTTPRKQPPSNLLRDWRPFVQPVHSSTQGLLSYNMIPVCIPACIPEMLDLSVQARPQASPGGHSYAYRLNSGKPGNKAPKVPPPSLRPQTVIVFTVHKGPRHQDSWLLCSYASLSFPSLPTCCLTLFASTISHSRLSQPSLSFYLS